MPAIVFERMIYPNTEISPTFYGSTLSLSSNGCLASKSSNKNSQIRIKIILQASNHHADANHERAPINGMKPGNQNFRPFGLGAALNLGANTQSQ
jgi:hypothetical protein